MSTTPVSLRPAAAELAGPDAQELSRSGLRHCSARALRSTRTRVEVAAFGDHGAGHDGLARSGRRDEHAVVVGEHRADRGGLLGVELAR